MVTTVNASTSSGLVNTADTSGVIKIQSNGVTTNAIAWCNFNGTLTSPITPNANYNVSTVTKTATGNYTLNFTNALSDANYSAVYGGQFDTGGTTNPFFIGLRATNGTVATKTTSALQISTWTYNGAAVDMSNISVAIFGN